MYRPLPKCLTIRESDIDGLGLFAVEDIPKDTNLGISHIKDDRFENGYSRTPLGGFFNHNESPNCYVKYTGDFIELITINDIKAGDELTAKYTFYNPKI